MRVKLILVFCLIAALAMACLESNPQPSPAGNNTLGSTDMSSPAAIDIPMNFEGEAEVRAQDTGAGPDIAPPDPCVGGLCPASAGAAPDPSLKGPFPVGVRTYNLQLKGSDGQPRVIRYEVWYPTTEEFRHGPSDTIDFYDDAPDYLKEVVGKYEGYLPPIQVDAVRDAPVRSNGPYPLVLFSHGAYGLRFQSLFFTIGLASHGYVVAAPDHDGNVLYNLLEADGYNKDDLIVSGLDRPLDATAVIDDMLTRNDTGVDPFFETIDPDRIGASGHSFGGYTAMYLGFADDRVDAVLALQPTTAPFSILGFKYEDFGAPVMMMAGRLDKTLDYDAEMYQPYLQLPDPKYYVELTSGGHFTYTNLCDLDLLYIANDLGIKDAENALTDGCGEENILPEEAHPIINQFGIGFFNFYLRNSQMSASFFDQTAADAHGGALYFESSAP